MSNNDIIIEFKQWINEFLSVPNDIMSGMPICPYAKQALISNSIRYSIVNSNLEQVLYDKVNNWKDIDDNGKIEVHAFITTDIEQYDKDTFINISEEINQYGNPLNILTLDDHPHNIEEINGTCLNFGKAALMLMSRFDMLNNASIQLAKTQYYNNWPKAYLEWVTLWRFKQIPIEFHHLQ